MVTEEDLLKQKIIPVYSNIDSAINKKAIHASYQAGLRYFEFTNRFENACDEFYALKRYCESELQGMMLGAGTIKNITDAEMFLSAGATFLVSPLISIELLSFVKNKKILWIPGCASASEIGMAENAGLKLVKIFPAGILGGTAFIKAMKGPFPAMQFLVTGNIAGEITEVKDYLSAGASAVGIGTSFFTIAADEVAMINKLQKLTDGLK